MTAPAPRLLAPVLLDVAATAQVELTVDPSYQRPDGLRLSADERLVMVQTPDGGGTGLWTDGG